MDLIDREELRERSMPVREFMRNNPDLHVVSLNQINRMPTIDAEPVRHGRWIHDINNIYGCSECAGRETMSPKKLKNYCSNCGAKMMEVQDD